MQATLATAAARIKAAVEKLELKWGKDAPLFSGGISYDERGLDDRGGYGDPHEDTRPDFVKADDEGWRKL